MKHIIEKSTLREAARLLKENEVHSLPVGLSKLCKSEDVRIITYHEAAEALKKLDLEKHTVGNPAFALCLPDKQYIFFDDTVPIEEQRMNIAHELGHALAERYAEELADTFAEELLMPSRLITPGMSAQELAKRAKVPLADAERRLAFLAAQNRKVG